MLDVYILEDSIEETNQLATYLRRIKTQLNTRINVHPFYSVSAIQEAMPEPSVNNVYILDLEIDEDSQAGLKFSQEVRKLDLKASIIFLTVHDEFLSTTYKYQVEALDFIVKRNDSIESDLLRDFQRVLKKQEQI